MTQLTFKPQLPLQKSVNFTNKLITLGDSYQQRRVSEKVNIVYTVTSEKLIKKVKDYYESILNAEKLITWQMHSTAEIETFIVQSFSFEQISTTHWVLKIDLEKTTPEYCLDLVKKIEQKTAINKALLTKCWEFIARNTKDTSPKMASSARETVRFFQTRINFQSQLLPFGLSTSKDYYLMYEAIFDLFSTIYGTDQISYLTASVEQYNNNQLYLFQDVPDYKTNPKPFWLPNAAYAVDNVFYEDFFNEDDFKSSGYFTQKTFTNGVFTFPANTRLKKAVKVFSGTQKSNYLASPLQSGIDYEIDFCIDVFGKLHYPDGYTVSYNNSAYPSNSVVLKNKSFNGSLNVNYILYNNLQSGGSFMPFPLAYGVYGNQYLYYSYTSYFLLNFYKRLSTRYYNFKLERSIKALEYSIPFIYENLESQTATNQRGVAPTYCYVSPLQDNVSTTWHGFYYLFEQNENLWRLIPNKTEYANNILDLKLAAMNDYQSKSITANSWIFTPIYTANRATEPTNSPNSFIEKDTIAGVDNGYSQESQYQIIANAAEYLFNVPASDKAKTIVLRWINGIFDWCKIAKTNSPLTFNPPSFFYLASEALAPAGDKASAYAAAMILKVAIYANLVDISRVKTIWLILEMIDYLMERQYVYTGLMEGTFTRNELNFVTPDNLTYKELKAEHHYEIIRTFCLLENKKGFLKYPGCSEFDAIK